MPNFCNVLMIPNSLRNLVFDAIQVYEFHVQEEDPNSVKPPPSFLWYLACQLFLIIIIIHRKSTSFDHNRK